MFKEANYATVIRKISNAQVQVSSSSFLLGKCYTNEFKIIIHNQSILWYSSISHCQDTEICIYWQL